MKAKLKAVLLHISDLHFGKSISTETPSILSKFGLATHDFALLQSLITSISQIPGVLDNLLNLGYKPPVDACIVTGDLTTDGMKGSFVNANTYILGRFQIGKEPFGLNFGKDALIVPGNHDLLLSRIEGLPFVKSITSSQRSWFYRRIFEKCPYVIKKTFNKMNFLFIGIDSNKVEKIPKNTAKGKVGKKQLKGIEKKLNKIKKEDKKFFNNCFKIAFLHHHLISPPKKDTLIGQLKESAKERILSHVLVDANDVIQTLSRNKVDMVLFGHKHTPYHQFYQGDENNIIMSCAGTATQMGNHLNSFKLYLFFSNQIRIIEYESPENSYVFQQKERLAPPLPYPNLFY